MERCGYCNEELSNGLGQMRVNLFEVERQGFNSEKVLVIQDKVFCNSICLGSYIRTMEEIHDHEDDEAIREQE